MIESRFGVKFQENDPLNNSTIETSVFKDAEECLNLISERLGSGPYLFGQAPSSADALLYGYLAPLFKAPFPNPTLQNNVKAHENLSKFVSKITLAYFAKVLTSYQKEEQIKTEQKSDIKEDSVDPKSLLFAGFVSASVMGSYAYFKGFSNELIESDDDENDDEDDEKYNIYNDRED